MFGRYFDYRIPDSVNESINDGGDCRTAPATTGPLMTILKAPSPSVILSKLWWRNPQKICHQLSYFDKRTPPPLGDDVIYVQPLTMICFGEFKGGQGEVRGVRVVKGRSWESGEFRGV